jgi:hypothetical protein
VQCDTKGREASSILWEEGAALEAMQFKTLMKMNRLEEHLPNQRTLLAYLLKQLLLRVSPHTTTCACTRVCVCGDIVMQVYLFVQKNFFLPMIISILLFQT